ncbi:MAG: GMC family oxidoreductase N-terminal domain-containing protein [Nitrososphaerota archaeon]|nr:GMC family oxidoreductase N-terminal domain-containing protein [Nitrososphaerota archaeon]
MTLELSGSERRAMAALCDTLFPGASDGSDFNRRSAHDLGVDSLLAEAVEHSLQPGNARDFRRVLSAVESPLYNLILTGRPVRFTSLGTEAREKYLEAWRDSPIALKRSAFQALKRLALFLAYASMGPNGSNPNWDAIGYPGASHDRPVPVPEELRLIPMAVDSDATVNTDVVIVGSGAGGSVIADSLAASGYDVLVLEQGPYETAETFQQNEMRMMQKLFQQSGTAATSDLSFVLLAGRGAGGGTTVNWNTCLKPPTRVLAEWESEFGIEGVAGPQFSAFLDEAWNAIGVNDAESQRNANNEVLWDGCKALGFNEGTDFHTISRNAVGCRERCDFCTYGCIYSAKQSTALTYLPRAQRRGARFVFDARAEQVVIEGGAAKGVVATVGSEGRSHRLEVKARAVVAACGAIETPALLLRSGVKDRNVGANLRLDPTVAVGGVFDRPIDPWKGPPQTVAVWKFIDLDGTYHGFWVEAAPAHPGLFALSIPWVNGKQHKDFMLRYYSRSSASIVLLRERSSGRVTLDKDGFARVSYDLERADRETLVRGMEETARILAAAGARGVWTTHNSQVFAGDGEKPLTAGDLDSFSAALRREGVRYNRMMLYSAHLMGSCRMSADPSKGPTSPTGELHTVRNLFVGDACVFPTTPAVNPMISIMAMSRRTAESIKLSLGGR